MIEDETLTNEWTKSRECKAHTHTHAATAEAAQERKWRETQIKEKKNGTRVSERGSHKKGYKCEILELSRVFMVHYLPLVSRFGSHRGEASLCSDICDLNVEEPIMNGNNDVRVISHVQLMRKRKNTTFIIYCLHLPPPSLCVNIWSMPFALLVITAVGVRWCSLLDFSSFPFIYVSFAFRVIVVGFNRRFFCLLCARFFIFRLVALISVPV